MTRISFLLFLWMTWMTTDDVIAKHVDKCTSCTEGSCSKSEMCAVFDTEIAGTLRYCVKAEFCKGPAGRKCAENEFCKKTPPTTTSYACVTKPCSAYVNGTCPPGQVCTPLHLRDRPFPYICAPAPKVCSGQSDLTCPINQVCTANQQGPNPYSCQTLACIDDSHCPKPKVCKKPGYCIDAPQCAGQTKGLCPKGQSCIKKEGSHSCEGVILCDGQYKGKCGKDEVCAYEKDLSGSKSWSCRSKVAPCPKDKRKCVFLEICRVKGTLKDPSFPCEKVKCNFNAECLVGEFCDHFITQGFCAPN